MGLDQYAFVKDSLDQEEGEEIAYWRKHPNLHGFMERLWKQRNPEAEGDFNCVQLPLTVEDIDLLESAVDNEMLPETHGFFFGGDSDEHYKDQDLAFCAKARQELQAGKIVVYDSWW
jgi:hypothetical protein